VDREDPSVEARLGAPRAGQPFAQDLAPGAGGAAHVDDDHAPPDEPVAAIDLEQLEGRARAVAVLLRELDVRIVEMARDPRAARAVLLLRVRARPSRRCAAGCSTGFPVPGPVPVHGVVPLVVRP